MEKNTYLKTGIVKKNIVFKMKKCLIKVHTKSKVLYFYSLEEYTSEVILSNKIILHNENGPAVEFPEHEYKAYYINGELHREDGPAIESNNSNQYFINGKRHREDGPAVHGPDIDSEYWLNGKRYLFKEWVRQRRILFLK